MEPSLQCRGGNEIVYGVVKALAQASCGRVWSPSLSAPRRASGAACVSAGLGPSAEDKQPPPRAYSQGPCPFLSSTILSS